MTSDFLFNDTFISNAKNHFDTLLFEHTFVNESLTFLGAIAHHTRLEQKLLIVSEKTPVDIIFPLIQQGKANTTIINPSCGITGFANKGYWDMRDISKARDFGLQVYDILYQEQIIDFFNNKNESCYIRVNEHTAWKSILPSFDIPKNTDIISFEKHGYSGLNGTILTFGTILPDTLYAAGYLQNEGHNMDVFAATKPFFNISNELKDSIQRNEKLIIIMDQHLGSLYESWLRATIFDAGLNNISIIFITPNYKNISSVAMEYMYEQAKIDGLNIANRIT